MLATQLCNIRLGRCHVMLLKKYAASVIAASHLPVVRLNMTLYAFSAKIFVIN